MYIHQHIIIHQYTLKLDEKTESVSVNGQIETIAPSAIRILVMVFEIVFN